MRFQDIDKSYNTFKLVSTFKDFADIDQDKSISEGVQECISRLCSGKPFDLLCHMSKINDKYVNQAEQEGLKGMALVKRALYLYHTDICNNVLNNALYAFVSDYLVNNDLEDNAKLINKIVEELKQHNNLKVLKAYNRILKKLKIF